MGVRPEQLGEGPVANQDSRPDVLVQRLRGEIGEGDENLLGVLDDRLGMWDLPGVSQVGGSREGWLGGTRQGPWGITTSAGHESIVRSVTDVGPSWAG
ncbi:MAG: hypothetical protein EBU21_16755 [Proteobacteria bacterium]|nr:hypothetical protein [Pseudomonadota bacterium]